MPYTPDLPDFAFPDFNGGEPSNGIPAPGVIRRDGTTADRLRQLHELKFKRQSANAEYDRCKEEYNVFQAEVFEEMKADGIDGLKVDGANFTRRTTYKGVVTDREAFHAWCVENDCVSDYFELRPMQRNLNELVSSRWDDHNDPDTRPEFPPGINSFEIESISSPNRKDS